MALVFGFEGPEAKSGQPNVTGFRPEAALKMGDGTGGWQPS